MEKNSFMQIIPAILPKNQTELATQVKQVIDLVSYVQVDVCDGVFVQSKTSFHELPYLLDMEYELDLMISEPEKNMVQYIDMQPARIIIHLESVKNWDVLYATLGNIRGIIEIGFCINNTTPNELLETHIAKCDFIQFMGIKTIGKQGESFDETVLEKISYFHTQYPEKIISVDGSVNSETIQKLVDVGAIRLICGSSIFGTKDVVGNIQVLEKLIN